MQRSRSVALLNYFDDVGKRTNLEHCWCIFCTSFVITEMVFRHYLGKESSHCLAMEEKGVLFRLCSVWCCNEIVEIFSRTLNAWILMVGPTKSVWWVFFLHCDLLFWKEARLFGLLCKLEHATLSSGCRSES